MSESSRAAIASNDPRVQAALQEYFAKVDQGESPEVEPFVARYADVAEELRSLIEFDAQARRMAQGARPEPSALPKAEVSTHSVVGKVVETSANKQKPSPGNPTSKRDAAAASMARRSVAASPPKSPPPPKSPNDLPELFGRYQVQQKLGEGAMGAVYLAEDTVLHRRVALKTPTFENDEDGELLKRFYREARAVANLKHPNLCGVYDVGEINGRHYISMEFVPGKKLTEFISLTSR